MQLQVDVVGYLFIFVGKDEELHRTSGTIDIVVEHHAHNDKGDKAKYHATPIIEDEVAATDDDDIREHDGSANTYVAILVDNGRYDIGTTRTTVVCKGHSHTDAGSTGSEHTGHKVLSGAKNLQKLAVVIDKPFLCYIKHDCHHGYAIDGLQTESPPYGTESTDEQDGIDGKV